MFPSSSDTAERTDWREFDDRDAYHDRIARDLAAASDEVGF